MQRSTPEEVRQKRQRRAVTLSRAVGGSLILLGVSVAVDATEVTDVEVLVTVIITELVTVLSRTYAEVIRFEIEHQRPANWRDALRLLVEHLPLAAGSAIPLVLFSLSELGLITREHALNWSRIALLLLIFFVTAYTTRLAGASRAVSTFRGAFLSSVGLAIVMLGLLM